jgi:hypothetical protein
MYWGGKHLQIFYWLFLYFNKILNEVMYSLNFSHSGGRGVKEKLTISYYELTDLIDCFYILIEV